MLTESDKKKILKRHSSADLYKKHMNMSRTVLCLYYELKISFVFWRADYWFGTSSHI